MKRTKSDKEYQAVFQEETEGGFSVWVPDLPGCASQGETLEEALENIKAAIELYLEDVTEDMKRQLDANPNTIQYRLRTERSSNGGCTFGTFVQVRYRLFYSFFFFTMRFKKFTFVLFLIFMLTFFFLV